MQGIEIYHNILNQEMYQRLRESTDWGDLNVETVVKGVRNSLLTVTALRDGELLGCGRIVGDGAMYFYLQDVMVFPQYQRQGVGKRIMEELMGFLKQEAPANAFIGLMAAEGVVEFYKKFGFSVRPQQRPGMFLIWK